MLPHASLPPFYASLQAQTGESVSTCKFAQRVARVSNRAEVNEEQDPRLVIKRLKVP